MLRIDFNWSFDSAHSQAQIKEEGSAVGFAITEIQPSCNKNSSVKSNLKSADGAQNPNMTDLSESKKKAEIWRH